MRGYIALITILVFMAVGLAVAISSGLLGIGGGQMSLIQLEKERASYLTTLCAEDVLEKLREDFVNSPSPYSLGSGQEICNVSVSGEILKTIQSQGQFKNKYQRLKIEVRKPSKTLIVNSWQEVASFEQ